MLLFGFFVMLVGLIHSYIDRSFNYQHRGFISRRFRGFLYPNAKLTLLKVRTSTTSYPGWY
jgi:hypothetical protein